MRISVDGAAAPAMQVAAAPTLDTVLRAVGPVFEKYVQGFKDNGLESFEDLIGLDAPALSNELLQLRVTDSKVHANRMARELMNPRP